MNKQARFIHLLVAASLGLLICCCLPPVAAVAQSLAPPLPTTSTPASWSAVRATQPRIGSPETLVSTEGTVPLQTPSP